MAGPASQLLVHTLSASSPPGRRAAGLTLDFYLLRLAFLSLRQSNG
jgi:hypothetical protein